jgi:hypothetical protein
MDSGEGVSSLVFDSCIEGCTGTRGGCQDCQLDCPDSLIISSVSYGLQDLANSCTVGIEAMFDDSPIVV